MTPAWLGVLQRQLLYGNVLPEVAVVLGQPSVDLDGQTQGIGHRLPGLHGAALRAADHAGDREPLERLG
jgi:hypothetical protein